MTVRAVSGSFRDPDSRVFVSGENVYRAFSKRGLADWTGYSTTAAGRRALESGSVIGTQPAELIDVPGDYGGRARGVVCHVRIPVISYPYEWSFGMLRYAA